MIDALMRYRLRDVADQRDCAPGSAVLLSRLAKQVYRRSNEEQLGMHLRHLVALSYVSDNDGVLLLNELEQQGYTTRVRDPSDRRRHLVEITPSGREALSIAERAQVE